LATLDDATQEEKDQVVKEKEEAMKGIETYLDDLLYIKVRPFVSFFFHLLTIASRSTTL